MAREAIGKHRAVEVPGPEGKHTYNLLCEDCGEQLGYGERRVTISFDEPRPHLDPADAGLAHAACVAKREEA